MAQDNLLGITNSLFGTAPTPQSDLEFGLKNIAGKSAAELGAAQAYAGGRQIGRGLMGLVGAEDPSQGDANLFNAAVRQVQQTGVDTSTAEGMKKVASALLNTGNTAVAQKAAMLAQAMEQKELDLSKTRAETGKITRGIEQDERLRAALAELPENATEDDFLRVYRQYGSPDQQARVIGIAQQKEADRQMRLTLASMKAGSGGGRQEVVSNNGVVAGYVDAKGNFFNTKGKKITDAELKDAQKSHDAASDLLYKLQNITENDIKNAYGSLADYTTMPGGKLVGSEATVSAQTKINEVGIRNVLNNLSQLKGASSDKEMTQMIKDFPGFQADPATMKKWMDRAVTTTNRFLQRSEQRYGYDTEYGQENRFGTLQNKPNTTTATPGAVKTPKTRTLKSGLVVTIED